MKTRVIPFLLILLLCGCHAGDRGITRVSSLSPPSEAVPACDQGLYDPFSELERQTSGAFHTFLLPTSDASGIRTLGDGLLLFSGREQTTLLLLQGDPLAVVSRLVLDFPLSAEDPSIQTGASTLSFFDPVKKEIIVTDQNLTIIARHPTPRGTEGAPIYAEEQNTVFYTAGNALYALDLETGRHRLLRNTASRLVLTGIHCTGSILQFQTADGDALFLSADTGQQLCSHEQSLDLTTWGQHYYGILPGEHGQSVVFGIPGDSVRTLKPKDPDAACFFLPGNHSAVTVSSPTDGILTLSHYDLETGLRTAEAELGESLELFSAASAPDGNVYLLARAPQYNQDVLYRWHVRKTPLRDPAVYTALYYTQEAPDLAGLARCRRYADELEETYGLKIHLWKDAVTVHPWDYDLKPEHRADILMDQLQQLSVCLSLYPPEILARTAAHFTSVNICLVSSITGTPESGLQDPATGVQFLNETDAYVAIAAGPFSDRALYHELFHLMEVHIFGNSLALDQWDSLNPAGFSYDYSYLSNKTRESGVYLRHDTRAFIDTYSMSYPREDRARILEYAMMPGNRELFQAQTLQRKLQAICKGIREAYGLENNTEIFLWEQYLE